MAKGGARTRSGPPPDPQALRRDHDAAEWTDLPADGRRGRTPKWPLVEPSERETQLWRGLWRKPQAIMWEHQGQELEVALYVRRLVEAEVPGTPANLTTLVRQMADSLGLTTPGLRSNRWRLVSHAEPQHGEAAAQSHGSVRDRFTVVAGEG